MQGHQGLNKKTIISDKTADIKRMGESDSSQAQLMVEDQEPSVTLEGMEKMAEADAMNT